MKINKKKLLKSISNNRNMIIGICIVVFVFCICLFPLIHKATYSVDAGDNLSIVCPESAIIGEEIECSIVLNAESMTVHGISGKIDINGSLVFEDFSYEEDSWNVYQDVNYMDSDGFLFSSDGVTGSSVIGKIKYTVYGTASVSYDSDVIYIVQIEDIVIADGDDTEVSLSDTSTEIIIRDEEVSTLSDINTLDNITLSNGTLNEAFDKNKNSYTANIDSDKVTINVTKTDEKSTVTGDIGEVTLVEGVNNLNIVVTSESGIQNVYTLSIYRQENIVIEYELRFDSDLVIDYDNKYIKYIDTNFKVDNLLDKVLVVGGSFKIYTKDGSIKDITSILCSGDRLVTYIGDEVKEEYVISVMGDPSGDGIVDLIDLVQMRKHNVGYVSPSTGEVYAKKGIYFYSLDLNKDGIVDLIDLVKMRKKMVGID